MEIKHGGNIKEIAEKYSLEEENIIDFSANINPLGMPEKTKQILRESIDQLAHYPDIRYQDLKQAIADYHQIKQSAVYPGNGAAEVIFNLAQVLQIKKILLLAPTFMEYEGAFRNYQTTFSYFDLESRDFTLELEELIIVLEKEKADGICLCNPNNPTGQLIAKKDLLQLAAYCRKNQVSLIIDEAFIDFTDEVKNSLIWELAEYPNLYIIRSLTKMFAIPGLRLGYLLTFDQRVMKRLDAITIPWHINTFADLAGQSILSDSAFIARSKKYITQERNFLLKGLAKFTKQIQVYPSEVNFLFLKYRGEQCLQKQLVTKGILIRKCDSFHGLTDNYYRIAVRTTVENRILLQAMEEILCAE